jgi:hypothetical protein
VEPELLPFGKQCLDQPRLAGSHGAPHEHRAAVARRRTPESGEPRGELALAALERRVQQPRGADGRPARDLAGERDRLRRWLHPRARELVAQQAQLACRRRPIAAREVPPHDASVGLLVGRLLAQELLPLAVLARDLEPPPPQARPRRERPGRVGIVRQELAAVGRVVPALEALDVGRHLRLRGELHHARAEHDRAPGSQRPARVARGLVQVRGGGIRAQLRPEALEHLVARHAVARRERKHLHKIRCAPLRPGLGRDGAGIDQHFEPSEQPDLELAHGTPTIQPRRRSSSRPLPPGRFEEGRERSMTSHDHPTTGTLACLGAWTADHRRALARFADRALSGAGWEAPRSESIDLTRASTLCVAGSSKGAPATATCSA